MNMMVLDIYECVFYSISLVIIGCVVQAAIDWLLMRELARVIHDDLKEEEI